MNQTMRRAAIALSLGGVGLAIPTAVYAIPQITRQAPGTTVAGQPPGTGQPGSGQPGGGQPDPGHTPPTIDQEALDAWKQCMQEHGVASPTLPRPPVRRQPGPGQQGQGPGQGQGQGQGQSTTPGSTPAGEAEGAPEGPAEGGADHVVPPSSVPPIDDATRAAREACRDKLPTPPVPNGQPGRPGGQGGPCICGPGPQGGAGGGSGNGNPNGNPNGNGNGQPGPAALDPEKVAAWKACMTEHGVTDPQLPGRPRPNGQGGGQGGQGGGQPSTGGSIVPAPTTSTTHAGTPSSTPPVPDDTFRAAFEACKDTLPVPPPPGNGNGQPGGGQPGGGQPGGGQPGGGSCPPMRPGNGQPGNGQPGNGQPGNGQPGNGQPGNGQPGNGQPGVTTTTAAPAA